jgi:hypothetical protein
MYAPLLGEGGNALHFAISPVAKMVTEDVWGVGDIAVTVGINGEGVELGAGLTVLLAGCPKMRGR